MRRKPSFRFLLTLICIAGAVVFWEVRGRHRANDSSRPEQIAQTDGQPSAERGVRSAEPKKSSSPGQSTNQNQATNAATASASANDKFRYRLKNTDEPLGKLVHNDKAILLANALIDTSKPLNLGIPDRLRANGNGGAYIVQASGALDDQFRALLRDANASIISFIPNNAYLVRVSDSGAQQIAGDSRTQSVLAWEPYYKLDASLLPMAMENPDMIPLGGRLNLTLFPDAEQATLAALDQLGAQVVAKDRSPFGPLVTVQAAMGTLSAIASLPGVEGVEAVHQRRTANDLDRPRLGVSADSVIATNYLGLSGTNVLVNINDDSVDANHPDLTGRITADFSSNPTDTNGHGTHVAGTILGSGSKSSTVSATPPGSVTNANFRGLAPDASAFVMSYGDPAWYLQEMAALTNALISNNSWNHWQDYGYDTAAASYDAAVRDSLPFVPGSQPMIYVFSAGNDGGGYQDGTGGFSDSILSPATAKNVITVGAIEELRNITNQVVVDGVTNNGMYYQTDNPDIVADFSSRGNVGINVEGTYGRFKPDLVAPGTFVISCSSTEWNSNAYYNPIEIDYYYYSNNVVGTGTNITSFLFPVPINCTNVVITLITNSLSIVTNLPPMPIYVGDNNYPDDTSASGTNTVTLNSTSSSNPQVFAGDTVYFDVGNGSSNTVHFDVQIKVYITNDYGTYFTVLSNLNNTIGPYYRYESGTSMAAAGVSGMLALMEEFFQQRWHVTNSPAMMKALLINGARSLSDQYDMAVNDANQPTFQGWGLPSLPNSIPPVLNTQTSTNDMASMPLQFIDQNPTNALATGQSMTWNLNLATNTSLQDLRVTLVWTDPPGNPQAGVKLVNDLDLIVSNTVTGEVFFGNDIPIGGSYNQAWDTNGAPNIDSVNNVENVFLPGPLDGTSYTVTVFGHRVNVNAVTANTNNVVQDYALVVSSGDANSGTGPYFSLAPQNNGAVITNNVVSNVFFLSNNVPYMNQRVGANSQYSGSTNGVAAQWNFYIYINTPALTNRNYTNVAFVTFGPPNLGLPRMEAFDELSPPDTNASRYMGADIDLYVSTQPGLTNLDPTVISNAVANGTVSLGRIGNEAVYFTNSGQGQVYYIGVKSEDQQAAQFNLVGFATDIPFSQQQTNGNTVVNMNTVPLTIPGGYPTQPSSVMLIGICTSQMQVRKVVVTNTVTCQDFGDYIGSLSQGQSAAVLNNHSFFTNVNDLTETLVYDDSGESEIPGALTSAGPGSLKNFTGIQASGTAWTYTIVNDSSSSDTGTIDSMSLYLERQPPPNNGRFGIDPLPAQSWYYGFVDVPPNATNLNIAVAGNVGQVSLYIQEGSFPSFSSYLTFTNIPPAGGISISKYDSPPLNAGRYYFGIYNPGNTPEANITLDIQLQYDLTPESASLFFNNDPELLLDDAVTYSTNYVSANNTVVSAEVGVKIGHPRESDLVLTLISPQGTRVLLCENRGGTDTNGFGAGTNYVLNIAQSAGTAAASGTNINVGANSGVINVSFTPYTLPDELVVIYDGNRIFDTGMVSGTNLLYTIPFGPGNSSNVLIEVNPYGNTNTQTQWTNSITITARSASYAVFTDDTNKTQLPIKFAVPPFGSAQATLNAVTNQQSSFEGIAAGMYPITIPFGVGQTNFWTVSLTNHANPFQPTVMTVPALAALGGNGSNVLALHGVGTISTVLPTQAGYKYTIAFAYHGTPSLTPISWWKAENNMLDCADGNSLYTINTNDVIAYTNGLVGRAFSMDGNVKLRAQDATNLYLTNAISVEGWVSPSNNTAPEQIILQRGSSLGLNPYTLSVVPSGGVGTGLNLQWQIMDTNTNATLIAPLTANGFVPNGFIHVGATYYWPTTNGLPSTNTNAIMTLYVNGLPVATTNTTIIPAGAIDPSLEPGLSVGNSAMATVVSNSLGFDGLLDEISLYSTNLTDAQMQDIFAAENNGKDPIGITPFVSADVIFGGLTNQIAALDEWQEYTYTFTAATNNMTLTIVPNQDGILLDNVMLIQDVQPNPANYYLAEESLSKLAGESALGNWKLEVWDNRVGATNPQPTLQSWELSLKLTDLVPYAAPLVNGMTQTNTVPANSIAYYKVFVPAWASFATNILSVSSGAVNLLFDQSTPPTGTNNGDYTLLTSVTTSSFFTLRTNGAPQLLPGQTYYLGVQNAGAASATFTLQVDFDITLLTNMVARVNDTIPFGNVPRYYQFNVTNGGASALFQVFNITNLTGGGVQLVASYGLPLPDTNYFNYISTQPGSNTPQNILVLSNSTPVPLAPGPWYLGVYNNTNAAVTYSIEASEFGLPNIIQLADGVPTNFNSGPGPALTNFFMFNITNVNISAALFELYTNSGDVDLTMNFSSLPMDYSKLPYAPPYFSESANPGTNIEQIVLRTNLLGTNLVGYWYLGVPNNTTNNVTYTILAVTSTNGILTNGFPIKVTAIAPPPGAPYGPTLNWPGVPGDVYEVEFTTNLLPLVVWTNLGTVVADGSTVTFTDTNAIPTKGMGFYRLLLLPTP